MHEVIIEQWVIYMLCGSVMLVVLVQAGNMYDQHQLRKLIQPMHRLFMKYETERLQIDAEVARRKEEEAAHVAKLKASIAQLKVPEDKLPKPVAKKAAPRKRAPAKKAAAKPVVQSGSTSTKVIDEQLALSPEEQAMNSMRTKSELG